MTYQTQIDIAGKEYEIRYQTVGDEIVSIDIFDKTWRSVGDLFDVFAGPCSDHWANLS